MAAIQPHQLGEAQAGAVHHLQHGAIAHRQRIVEIDLQQLVHFIDVDVFRQMAAATRRADAFGGVGVQYAPLTSQSRKLRNEESRSAGLADCRPARLLRAASMRTRAASSAVQSVTPISCARAHQRRQLARIAELRQRAELPFYLEITQKSVHRLLQAGRNRRHARSTQRSSSSGSMRAS